MTEAHYPTDILILLAAAIVMVPIFKRLGLGSVLGYLTAGTLVGPWGFAIIDRIDEIRHIAEFGVVFLLFIIGIELWSALFCAMRRLVFGLGTAQVMVTGLALAFLFDQTLKVAIVIGFGLIKDEYKALADICLTINPTSEPDSLRKFHSRRALSRAISVDPMGRYWVSEKGQFKSRFLGSGGG